MLPDNTFPRSHLAAALRAYFRSGWAFLIPYLATYLLYWWLRWPVNPVAGEGAVKGASESGQVAIGHGFWAPPLLHVYWALHAINVVLAVVALVAWLRGRMGESAGTLAPPETPMARAAAARSPLPLTPAAAPYRPPLLPLLLLPAPWLLLALVFYIPGVYLEFPADPWTHYARVNEWSRYEHIDQNYDWRKSSYLLSYSLIGRATPPLTQVRWFDLYYTGCCLLLCWQYYRWARAIGLGERASMLFVFLQALLFGNNIFGFYRYYGMSSTLFSQLGAVALVRIAIEALTPRGQAAWSTEQGQSTSPLPAAACPPLASASSRFPASWTLFRASVAAVALLTLTAFNHVQGLGIAGLGLGAVFVWRLIEWRRSAIIWLAAAMLALSVAVILWWPRNPALDSAYRSAGWLSAWYGFNVLSLQSPAGDRTLAILGFFGVVNLVAGLLLLRNNHVAGWLTVTPLVALCLPWVAIPFADVLAEHGTAEILTFHRMLLAVPCGLSIVCVGAGIASRRNRETDPGCRAAGRVSAAPSGLRASGPMRFSSGPACLAVLLLVVTALVIAPAQSPCYSRFWHALTIPPGDLSMRHVLADLAVSPPRPAHGARLFTIPGIGFAAQAAGARNVPYAEVRTNAPVVLSASYLIYVITSVAGEQKKEQALMCRPRASYTPVSLAGQLSGHWFPQEATALSVGAPEVATAARRVGAAEIRTGTDIFYLIGDWQTELRQRR